MHDNSYPYTWERHGRRLRAEIADGAFVASITTYQMSDGPLHSLQFHDTRKKDGSPKAPDFRALATAKAMGDEIAKSLKPGETFWFSAQNSALVGVYREMITDVHRTTPDTVLHEAFGDRVTTWRLVKTAAPLETP